MQRAILFFVILSLASGCKSAPIRQPQLRFHDLKVPKSTKQDDSPCEKLKKTPKTIGMLNGSHEGFWIARQRMLCFVARSKVARSCRPACEKRVSLLKKGCADVQNTLLGVSKKREAAILRSCEAARRRFISYGVAIGISSIILGVGAGIFIGVVAF